MKKGTPKAPSVEDCTLLYDVRLLMTWDKPMAVMVAMNSCTTSDPMPREGRLKSPKIISLGNSSASPDSRSAGRVAAGRKVNKQQSL